MNHKLLILQLSLLLLSMSCATYQKYEDPVRIKPETESDKDLEKRIFLIGNTENTSAPSAQQTLASLQNQLKNASSESVLIFLGNYVTETCRQDSLSKEEIESNLAEIQKYTADYQGKIVFIPGMNDWRAAGLQGLQIQQDFIEKNFGKKSFVPEDACAFKKVNLSDDIVLLVLDATWFIENWDRYPDMNSTCDVNTRERFYNEIDQEIKKLRGKTTIVAMAAPVVSNGERGGHYTAKSDLIPLPVVGNVKNMFRNAGGMDKYDLNNNHYHDLVLKLTTLARQNKKIIFVSAHENNMQYITYEKALPQIIVGSANQIGPTKNMNNTIYSEAAHGFAVLDVYKNGAADINFVNTDKGETSFMGEVYPPDPIFTEKYQKITQDSMKASVFTQKEAHKGFIYRFLMGNRFRKYYGTEVLSPVANIEDMYGGLRPIREGGGHQSISLHLKDSTGQQYKIRSLKKSSEEYMQAVTFRNYYFQDQLYNTVIADLVEDYFTGSHPYSVILAEPLTRAIGLPSLDSKIIYLPKQDALGKFNVNSGNKISVIEKDPGDLPITLGNVHFQGNVYDTYEMMSHIEKDGNHQLDQKNFVKARIFDMLIGDWDRHYKQWKFLEYEENGQKIYRTLPLDRDMAFSKMGDGILTKIALFFVPSIRLISNYKGDLKDVKHFNQEPYRLDSSFLPDLSMQDWLDQAAAIQTEITDEIIDEVFANMPKELQGKDLDKLKVDLKSRKSNLQAIAKRYYLYVAKYPKIMGTNKKDYFKIEVLPDKNIELSVYNMKDGQPDLMYHHRVFSPHETKALWIYGMDDEDTFELIGKGNTIKLVLAGGPKKDTYIVPEHNNVSIFDYKSSPNDVSQAKKARKHLMDFYDLNHFDYHKTYDSDFEVFPMVTANQDVGTKLSLSMTSSQTRFKGKNKQKLKLDYYSATDEVYLKYSFTIPKIIRKIDFSFDAEYNSSESTINFFGYGNDTPNYQDSISKNYNRVGVTGYSFSPTFSRGLFSGFYFNVAANYQNQKVVDVPVEFQGTNTEIPNYLLNSNHYLGFSSYVSYNNLDYSGFPKTGLMASLAMQYASNMSNKNHNIFKVSPEIQMDYNISQSGNLLFATHLLGSYIFGDEYEFFQAATIGHNSGLRGYRDNRFSGKASFVQSSDLRWQFKRTHNFLMPAALGIYGGFDYGRVWVDHDPSKKWHYSYGGGIFINFVESAALNLAGFNTEDGFQVSFKLGFGF